MVTNPKIFKKSQKMGGESSKNYQIFNCTLPLIGHKMYFEKSFYLEI